MRGRGGARGALRRAGTLSIAAAAMLLAAAPAHARVEKLTYSVPVTQPDELGQPVALDTDLYLPAAPAPHPLVMLFHGGGSDKSNPYDAGHAEVLAEHGYAVILYSARGHGSSGGQTTIIGPKEVRDAYDVAAWALGIGGRDDPAHPDFGIDPARMALAGYSQGGLHTNLIQAHGDDPALNPYGLRFRVLLPGNTPDYTYEALVQNGALKLSFGVGLLQTYLVGAHAHVSPLIAKWVAQLSADQPGLAGGALCDDSVHDTATSTTKQDLAFRSPGCFVDRMTPPSLWAQAFDDGLFPPDMAISMWRRMPNPANRLYLSMGGHAAPAAPQAVEDDRLHEQIAFLDRFLQPGASAAARGPAVVYWRRDPRAVVPGNAYRYPDGSWTRLTSPSWPPPGISGSTLQLGSDGTAATSGAPLGAEPLAPFNADLANDPVAAAAFSSTPVGTSPIPRQVPTLAIPGFLGGFQTAPFAADRELSGSPRASLGWTPLSPDTQLIVKLLDRAPDGTLTLLSRGVTGIRGAAPGIRRQVEVPMNAISALIPAGHSLVAWVTAADASFYEPYVPSLGGILQAGPGSTLTLPLGSPR